VHARSRRCPGGLTRPRCTRRSAAVPSTAVTALRVAIVDDDQFSRRGMVIELDPREDIDVVFDADQEQALALDASVWETIDVVIVELFDITAPGEIGTDLYSGIPVIVMLHALGKTVLAISPKVESPLVRLRIFEASPRWVYARHEVWDADRLVEALLNPDPAHVPIRPSKFELEELGAERAQANEGVRRYTRFVLYPRLRTCADRRTVSLATHEQRRCPTP
jgi:hypothetical protein